MSINQNLYRETFQLELRKDKNGNVVETNLPIQYVVTFKGQRIKYYTGYRIDAKNFGYKLSLNSKGENGLVKTEDTDTPRAKSNTFNKDRISATVINNRLRDLMSATSAYFEENKKAPSSKALTEYLNEHIKGNIKETTVQTETPLSLKDQYNLYLSEIEPKPLIKKQHESLLNLLTKFAIEEKFDLTLDSITGETLSKFEKWLLKRNCSLNAISPKLKKLKTFYKNAVSKKLVSKNPFDEYKIPIEMYGTPIIITKTERDYIRDYKIDNDKLDRVRDLFILQCHLGCRVSDFFTLKKENIINDSIHYIAEKTKNENAKTIRVPLTPTAQKIIKKYNFPGGMLMPFISDVKYNVYLKDLFKLLDLKRPVSWLNPKTRMQEIKPLHEFASSHLARRTFIGLAHKANIKNEVIASMSGHAPDSRAFQRYYSIDEDQQNNAILSLE